MEQERIEAAIARIADATGRIDAAAAEIRQSTTSPETGEPAAPAREAVAAALAELDALLEQLQR